MVVVSHSCWALGNQDLTNLAHTQSTASAAPTSVRSHKPGDGRFP